MEDMKTTAAAHHNDAALHLENAARMHREAAHQCESGNFEKAQYLATEAAETDTAANQHAMQALDLYRRRRCSKGRKKGRKGLNPYVTPRPIPYRFPANGNGATDQ